MPTETYWERTPREAAELAGQLEMPVATHPAVLIHEGLAGMRQRIHVDLPGTISLLASEATEQERYNSMAVLMTPVRALSSPFRMRMLLAPQAIGGAVRYPTIVVSIPSHGRAVRQGRLNRHYLHEVGHIAADLELRSAPLYNRRRARIVTSAAGLIGIGADALAAAQAGKWGGEVDTAGGRTVAGLAVVAAVLASVPAWAATVAPSHFLHLMSPMEWRANRYARRAVRAGHVLCRIDEP